MERRDFAKTLAMLGICPVALGSLTFGHEISAEDTNEVKQLKGEKEFIQNWLSDLLDSMEKHLDRETMVKVVEGCGKGCYNRHKFKQDIAEKGKGDLDRLIGAYSQNFEIWKDTDKVHIRYGSKSPGCYCPAAKNRQPKENDIHCECTKMTHQTIFETALGRPVKIDILESVRRGGQTCHFLVNLV